MMTSVRRTATAAGTLAVLAAALIQFPACGDDDDSTSTPTTPTTATVGGNVSSVTGPSVSMAPAGSRWLAFWNVFGPSQAVAQACTADNVLVCVDNGDDETCSAVDETDCDFAVTVDVVNGLTVRFVSDTNDDGTADGGEPDAALTNSIGEACAGLTVTLNDVDIDFDAGTATADTVGRDPEDCPTPTPAPTSTPEPTATPEPTPAP